MVLSPKNISRSSSRRRSRKSDHRMEYFIAATLVSLVFLIFTNVTVMEQDVDLEGLQVVSPAEYAHRLGRCQETCTEIIRTSSQENQSSTDEFARDASTRMALAASAVSALMVQGPKQTSSSSTDLATKTRTNELSSNPAHHDNDTLEASRRNYGNHSPAPSQKKSAEADINSSDNSDSNASTRLSSSQRLIPYPHEYDTKWGGGKKSRDSHLFRKSLLEFPQHLPPLIAKLVGSVDETLLVQPHSASSTWVGNDSLTKKQQDSKQTRTEPDSSPPEKVQRVVTKGINSYHHTLSQEEDSVTAVAAAAAAAAMLSTTSYPSSIRNKYSHSSYGRLRMKTYNDQWDAALQWVASWGDDTLDDPRYQNTGKLHMDKDVPSTNRPKQKQGEQQSVNVGHSTLSPSSSTHTSSTTTSTTTTKTNPKKIRPSKGSTSTDNESFHINKKENGRTNSHVLQDTCLEECILSKDWASFSHVHFETIRSTKRKKKQRSYKDTSSRGALVHGKKSILRKRTLLESLSIRPWRFYTRLIQMNKTFIIIGSLVGMILSSTLLWSLVNTAWWGKTVKYHSNDDHQVFEDNFVHDYNSNPTNFNNGLLNTNRQGKKTSQRKGKKKKLSTRINRNKTYGSQELIDPKQHLQNCQASHVTCDDEDSIDSDDTYDLSHFKDTRVPVKQISRVLATDDIFVGMGSNSCTPTASTASCMTDDTEFSNHTSKYDVSRKSNIVPNTECYLEPVQRLIHPKESSPPLLPTKSSVVSIVSSVSARPTQETHSIQNSMNQKRNELTLRTETTVLNHSSARHIHIQPRPQLVPTNEQRKEAERNLRDYQQSQIMKIINQREANRIHDQQSKLVSPVRSDGNERHIPNTASVKPFPSMTSNVSSAEHVSPATTPPPGLQRIVMPVSSQMSQSFGEKDRETALDEINGESLLLSNMLDEDDEWQDHDDNVKFLLSLVGNHTSSHEQSPCDGCETNFPDASFSLKVTAKSFSPSWVKTETVESRIW